MDYPNATITEDTLPVETAEPNRLPNSWRHRLQVAQWIERYGNLIRHIQTLEDPSVDRVSSRLDAWQTSFAQAGRQIAQQEQLLKNKLARYARSLFSGV